MIRLRKTELLHTTGFGTLSLTPSEWENEGENDGQLSNRLEAEMVLLPATTDG